MKRKINIEELLAVVTTFKGKEVRIVESITTNRPSLDRHFCTNSVMKFKVNEIETWLSGAHLRLRQDDDHEYAIGLDRVVEFMVPAGFALSISEYFEEKTERQTTIEEIK